MEISDEEHEKNLKYLERFNDPKKWLYGSLIRDKMLIEDATSFPRYRHLADKAFIRYAGEHYNPHTVSMRSIVFIRLIIKNTIEYKVTGRLKAYDWVLIDNFLKKFISDELNLNLTYDQKRIDEGLLPEFKSPFHDLDWDVIN